MIQRRSTRIQIRSNVNVGGRERERFLIVFGFTGCHVALFLLLCLCLSPVRCFCSRRTWGAETRAPVVANASTADLSSLGGMNFCFCRSPALLLVFHFVVGGAPRLSASLMRDQDLLPYLCRVPDPLFSRLSVATRVWLSAILPRRKLCRHSKVPLSFTQPLASSKHKKTTFYFYHDGLVRESIPNWRLLLFFTSLVHLSIMSFYKAYV